ncbi:HERC2 [Symbiodinium pilosum]|uniref:HERC2 protein n=1 Tax=Symbiodinium pilosum TaxID=2952 RepID=A0A812LU72_SYMPI|nr:HERC2 [Symbiodinium pilosum]
MNQARTLQLLSALDVTVNASETGGVLGELSVETPTGSLKVVALSPEAVLAAGSVDIPAGPAKVQLPADVLMQAAELAAQSGAGQRVKTKTQGASTEHFDRKQGCHLPNLPGISGPILLSLTSISEATASKLSDARVEGEVTAQLQSQPLSLNLRGSDGAALKLSRLRKAIELVLSVRDDQNVSCAYWDEATSRWSLQGLTEVLETKTVILCKVAFDLYSLKWRML